MSDPRLRHAWKVVGLAAVLLLAPVAALQLASRFVSFPSELLEGHAGSIRVLDRESRLLREVRPKDGSRTAWIRSSDVPLATRALVATEDRRFMTHHGVDYQAAVRAVISNISHVRTVSGASTITMQLARTVRPHRRTILGKFLEAALALRIERTLTKAQILDEYVNRAPFGPNLRGVGAASLAYFDKSASALSLGEASLLAGMVRAPSYFGLHNHPDDARRRRKFVLSRMVSAGTIDETAARIADQEPVVLQQHTAAFGAPHFVRALLAGRLGPAPSATGGMVTTTLDVELQRAAEVATQRILDSLRTKHVTAASVVVLDNATSDILAYIGSPDFFDDAHNGQIDGVLALRQPGSALKPFVYELAMERLGVTPATVLPDIELHLPTPQGDFSPHNYDESFHGPVRMREALANSLNVPAVFLADRLGPPAVLERLHGLGFSLERGAEDYGAAIALGDGEVTLLELTRAYSTLARGGLAKPVRAALSFEIAGQVTSLEPGAEERVMPELHAARITDVLKDGKARVASFGEQSVLDLPFETAAKTGTSKGFRDNWAVGYTTQRTVGVWVGNFDGSPMDHVSGVAGAGPLFHDVMAAAMEALERAPLAVSRSDVASQLSRIQICPLSGARVTSACPSHVFEWFTPSEAAELAYCEMHERVAIDERTGLLAGRTPSVTCRSTTKTFERFPPRYAAWALGAGRPLAPTEVSRECADDSSTESEGGISIRYPLDGAHFVIDPDRPAPVQVLTISVVAPEGTPEVTLLVDGAPVDRARNPYTLRWPLSPGDHELIARAGSQRSAPISIHVRQ
jgi:penicillin-binding protein 1C